MSKIIIPEFDACHEFAHDIGHVSSKLIIGKHIYKRDTQKFLDNDFQREVVINFSVI